MTEPIITLKDVSYSYPHAGETPPALAGLSFSLGRGEFVAVVGANGSGKTTLARMLNGLLLPDAGAVIVDGMATRDRKYIDAIRERVGLVFQNPESQIVANSVEDDIAFGLENIGLPADEIDARVDATLKAFGLERLRESEPHWLSGGQKQRTVLAGVMAIEPEVLVLDEPTSMLDPRSRHELLTHIDGLWRDGRTIVYITHVMEEAAGAERVIVLREGSVGFDGKPRELFADAALLESAGLTAPLPARLARELNRRGLGLPMPLTLEELVG